MKRLKIKWTEYFDEMSYRCQVGVTEEIFIYDEEVNQDYTWRIYKSKYKTSKSMKARIVVSQIVLLDGIAK